MNIISNSSRVLRFFGQRIVGNTPRTLIRWESTNKSTKGSLHLSNFDKRILVWTKKYKSLAEVPDAIAPDVMERARSRFRIKYANYGLVITLLGCAYMVYRGKQAAEEGGSVHQMNLDWHDKVNKEMDEKAVKNKS